MVQKINLKQNKKAISTIVATILLILLTIISIFIVWEFVRPFVREGLEREGSCFEALGKVKIVENLEYTCKKNEASETYVMVERKDVEINGLAFALILEGNIESIKIIGDENHATYETTTEIITDIKNTDGELELPAKNSARTYIITGLGANKVAVYPIINENICPEGDEVELEECAV